MQELESDPIQILFFLFEVQPYQIIVSHWLIEKKYGQTWQKKKLKQP